jgi:hypothetical protein
VKFGMGIRLRSLYYESSSARQHGMNARRRRMRNGLLPEWKALTEVISRMDWPACHVAPLLIQI